MSQPISFEQRKLMAKAGLEPVLNEKPTIDVPITKAFLREGLAAIKEKEQQKQREANDARKLQLMIARVQKAIGNKADSNIVVGACVHILAQVILQIPMAAHSRILQNIVNGIETCVVSGYPKEMVEKMQADREATAAKLSQEVIDQMANQLADEMQNTPRFATGATSEVEDGVPTTDQG